MSNSNRIVFIPSAGEDSVKGLTHKMALQYREHYFQTGCLGIGWTDADYDAFNKLYPSSLDWEGGDTDPAGGSGLYSHR